MQRPLPAGQTLLCQVLRAGAAWYRSSHTTVAFLQVNEKYAGGCHKGELTLIGQQQVRASDARLVGPAISRLCRPRCRPGSAWEVVRPAHSLNVCINTQWGQRLPRSSPALPPQALDFGRYLRWRYSMVHPLLPESWQDGAVVARTTSYQRTIATLQVGRVLGWGGASGR